MNKTWTKVDLVNTIMGIQIGFTAEKKTNALAVCQMFVNLQPIGLNLVHEDSAAILLMGPCSNSFLEFI